MLKNVYSVGQVNSYIKNMFSQDFMLHRVSIKGEVSNCKYHSSGHIYFTLKDSQGTMSAIMFAGNRKGLDFVMKEGDKVIVTGSVEVYERDGKYQIYAKQIELDGAGNLYLKFEALKRELEEMGMFDSMYKKKIPRYANRIGVVTAPTGAAIQDIRNITARRNPFVQLILYPALVQGDGACASIVSGINALEKMNVDVIIVGRGGGSIEDLWAFNEEAVARAVFECSVPIISAVGHETDTTIIDYVADLRAPTPSAAAELAVFDYRNFLQDLNNYKRRIDNALRKQLELSKEQLAHYNTRLRYLSPQYKLNENKRRILEYEEKIKASFEKTFEQSKQRLLFLTREIEAYSPVKKLNQGYAYIEKSDKTALKSVHSVKPGEEVTVHLLDGEVKAEVSEVKSYE
ncbi:MAG: exodeoxyribonuclease VII large subunit [Agathobacter sp.]|nr:exodeoxyribonuclease VII large subunit [Agathobacter sp.]